MLLHIRDISRWLAQLLICFSCNTRSFIYDVRKKFISIFILKFIYSLNKSQWAVDTFYRHHRGNLLEQSFFIFGLQIWRVSESFISLGKNPNTFEVINDINPVPHLTNVTLRLSRYSFWRRPQFHEHGTNSSFKMMGKVPVWLCIFLLPKHPKLHRMIIIDHWMWFLRFFLEHDLLFSPLLWNTHIRKQYPYCNSMKIFTILSFQLESIKETIWPRTWNF